MVVVHRIVLQGGIVVKPMNRLVQQNVVTTHLTRLVVVESVVCILAMLQAITVALISLLEATPYQEWNVM